VLTGTELFNVGGRFAEEPLQFRDGEQRFVQGPAWSQQSTLNQPVKTGWTDAEHGCRLAPVIGEFFDLLACSFNFKHFWLHAINNDSRKLAVPKWK